MVVMKENILLNLDTIDRSVEVFKALSSETRLSILKMLIQRSMSISEIAEMFYLPMSSACMHTKILHNAGLISFVSKSGLRGSQKSCGIKVNMITLDLFAHLEVKPPKPIVIESMPIGNFFNCEVYPPCGVASEICYLSYEDTPYGFYSTERNQASLIWFSKGFLEYKFSNNFIKNQNPTAIELSFEICSEAPGYNNDWPSDITLEINDQKITTFRTKGDYGDRRGVLNPEWWNSSMTQYGEFKRLQITNYGCYLDNQPVSNLTINSLNMENNFFFTLKIGILEDAKCVGGINLFGKSFGDYPQDIVMKISY